MPKLEGPSPMRRIVVIFFQIVVVLIGVTALAFLLLEPQFEGVNRHRPNFEIYFQDPLLALAYLGALPFFAALYQANRVLGYVGKNLFLSPEVVRALWTIKWCMLFLMGFVAFLVSIIFLSGNRDSENPGAPIFLSLLVFLPSIVVAVTAGMLQRFVQNSLDLQSKSNLAV